MRLFCLLVCFFTLQLPHIASAQSPRNLAYEDKFVWYLSGRLASGLTEFQAKSGIKLSEAKWAEQRDQLEILYHHYLVECNGPLSKIAEIFRFYDSTIEPDVRGLKALAYVGSMEYKIWPILQEWNGKIFVQLLSTYGSGRYGFFPECVVQGFREQNPIPGAASK